MVITGLVLGTALGIVMQRGRFCVTGMLRDISLAHTWRPFTALLIVIAIHAVGIAGLTTAGIIQPEYDLFPPYAVIVGGFLFGIGIVLAGGCASGTWYRSGEGLVGSWFALLFYGLSAAAMKTGALAGLNSWLRSKTVGLTTVHGSLGISVWWLAIPFAAFAAGLAAYFLRSESTPVSLQSGWKKPLHLYTAGVLVGLLSVIAWPLSAATGRNDGLGITSPTANLTNFLVTGESARIDWGVMLVLGILVGSFIAAKATGEFRVRVPDATQTVKSIAGGTLMGIGAAWAGGCTVGNGMVQTGLFTYQGWVALAAIAAGVFVAAKIWLKPSPQPELSLNAPVLAASAVTVPSGLREVAPTVFALDTLGSVCPFPLIDAKEAMNELDSGESLRIDFDCTQATESIPRWAADEGFEVTDFHEVGDAGWQITVRK
ncbi:YeeE/YedE thiosulfate transporter family protein [Corynebacterium pyruviciproducens]|uniref:YeeE/YedE thiosulfate transporter family protein n=1 Tax=Corynebacterium pyruviciproducens TaxID=598660 RepID=UPI0023F3FE64|nr:YeeE/YedE thiosulfate transporter family protein [Corynebacterium pyruviciproducens]MDK6565817.1 YeeE/YedE thiosulfate transporter family protein [Corynebacterium pyruviciproducens]